MTEAGTPRTPPDDLPAPEVEAEAMLDAEDAEDAEDAAEDRLFSFVALGLILLLLICAVLVLIAARRPPAGL